MAGHGTPSHSSGHCHASVAAHWCQALACSLWALKFHFRMDLKNGLIGFIFWVLFWVLFLRHQAIVYLDHWHTFPTVGGGQENTIFGKFSTPHFFWLVLIATTVSCIFREFEFLGEQAGTGLWWEHPPFSDTCSMMSYSLARCGHSHTRNSNQKCWLMEILWGASGHLTFNQDDMYV